MAKPNPLSLTHFSRQATPAPKSGGGLYIHIPFCTSLCSYCHFVVTDEHDTTLRRRLVAGIVAEFALRRQQCAVLREGRRPLETVYVGGGTPSVLEPELMVQLLAGTAGRLPAGADLEVTAEANPESFTDEVADAWLAAGIQRVSLGVQSFDAALLARLGRQCDVATARHALGMACRRFGRVSADWILGPGVRRETLLAELAEAVATGVGHISLYILELHEGTRLAAAVRSGRVTPLPDDQIESIYLAAVAELERLGLRQYEVTNFARPGQESRHNRNYWRRVPYLGLGPGAHGFWGRRRYANLADTAAYLQALQRSELPEAWCESLDPAVRRLERLILALRTTSGVPLSELPASALPWAAGVADGLWRLQDDALHLTAKGFLRINCLESLLASAADGFFRPGAFLGELTHLKRPY